jgi:methylthioribose-1-phosphate isomerase
VKVDGKSWRTIWPEPDGSVGIIDQRHLPHAFVVERLTDVLSVARAIADMHVRGAGLIGATAAWGMYLAAREAGERDFFGDVERSAALLCETRPTAVNLSWAAGRVLAVLRAAPPLREARLAAARAEAEAITDGDAAMCASIGHHGLALFRDLHERRSGAVVNVLTHCNAGWLAFVDHGSATAPIYAAHDAGIPVHVWVDETRPRNQGASLTAWELGQHGVPHTVIVDNAGGHLMQHGRVDLVITGADRVTRQGDAANKIGTYLKALAARDNGVPFYVALPSSTFDWRMRDGLREIPIEERSADEVRFITGHDGEGVRSVRVTPPGSPAANPGFDVTPARLITGLITERGVCAAREEAIVELFPDHKDPA